MNDIEDIDNAMLGNIFVGYLVEVSSLLKFFYLKKVFEFIL